MSDEESTRQFVQGVRDVLAHLYDTTHLQRHALVPYLVPADVTDPRARAQYLRETVIQSIAALKPPAGVSPRDPAYRPYAILRGKYVEGLSSEEVQDKLAIGRRQFFREQQRAVDGIAAVLWERRLDQAAPGADSHAQALSDELEQLGLRNEVFAVEGAAREAIAATAGLAVSRRVGLSLGVHGRPEAFADEAITRQLLISLLGSLVQLCADCRLHLALGHEGRSVVVAITGLGPDVEGLESRLLTAGRLASHLGGQLSVDRDEEGRRVRLRLPTAREETVAIVDDNTKTLRLFERYLEPYRYRPVLIQDSTRALADIRALHPDVVVLDIMMREVDGWAILQSLRTDPATRDIAVIVCSVLDDAQLARSLGAAGYIRKPVSQAELVRALDQARRARDGAPGTPGTPLPASA